MTIATNAATWPWRQIAYLHTAGSIPDVGAGFDADECAAAFRDVQAPSTCSRNATMDTAIIRREMHPSLSFDLLGAQIAALQGASIRTPI